jgi:DNA-directed RNA polymerase specialized sigma24 family protein
MEQKKNIWKAFASARSADEVLESRYDQLLRWGAVLTRGDTGVAREIVHDLCLYLILTKADFNGIANLDGYLYTSLRHIYLSHVTRASRQALRFVSVADFDSIQFVIANNDRGDSVAVQNELRAICSYAVWRKDASKSFSYFVLHFFHGYFPREIADIAGLPVSAIYNKLKSARTELKAHLSASERLRLIKSDTAPTPYQTPVLVSTAGLFQEIRETILQARRGLCLPEEVLLSHYISHKPSPVPCELLSHIVSCERCLAAVDRHFRRPTLKDRDALDGFDRALNMQDAAQAPAEAMNVTAMFESIRRRKERIYHHRPQALFIAVNARVVAFHDVQGIKSTLSVRVDYSERANVVEVFSEQQVRLAMVVIDRLPPDCPDKLSFQTLLSDSRKLDLNLSFDGLGLQSELIYFDPQATAVTEDSPEELLTAASSHLIDGNKASWIRSLISPLMPSPRLAWSLALTAAVCAGGYVAYRYNRTQLDASVVLGRAIDMETTNMAGAVRHQTLDLTEITADGSTLRGTVELWQQGENGRLMRRLYDTHHHLLASEWRDRDGTLGRFVEPERSGIEDAARQLAANDLWTQDLSSRAFHAVAWNAVHSTAYEGGYKLTATGVPSNEPSLQSAVLLLNRHLNTVSEDLYYRNELQVRELRLVQSNQEYEPSSKVPDGVFSPEKNGDNANNQSNAPAPQDRIMRETDRQLTQLEIAVLDQLNRLGADIGDPIDIGRTTDGRIRVYGTISDDARRLAIVARLKMLPDQQYLTIQLGPQNDVHRGVSPVSRTHIPASNIFTVTHPEIPSASLIRRYFETKGWTGDDENVEVAQFSQLALERAQRSLQHAYALDRLGKSFTAEELRSASPTSQRLWVGMVSMHASALEMQLRALHEQLEEIAPEDDKSPPRAGLSNIGDPAVFALAADRLLQQTQVMNHMIGTAFASGTAKTVDQDGSLILTQAQHSIPLQEASEIVGFTERFETLEARKNGRIASNSRLQTDRLP